MGKKGKIPKAQKAHQRSKHNNERDFLEARAIRKREQHKKQAEKEKNERIQNEINIRQWKEEHREKKVIRWADDLPINEKLEVQQRKEITINKTDQETKPPLPDVSLGPPVPQFDKRKVEEVRLRAKKNCLIYLKLKWNITEENITTGDMTTLEKVPRFNGISKAVEQTVSEIKKRNEDRSNELSKSESKQREEFRTMVNDEFAALMDLQKYRIVFDELKVVLNASNLSQSTPAANENKLVATSPRIPTREDFKEVTKMLRGLIAARNGKLTNCCRADFRRNKISDNFVHVFSLLQRHKYLLDFITGKRLENKTMGNRVLQVSVILLNKMKERLRKQTKHILTKTPETTTRAWNKKMKKYRLKSETRRRNISRMKESLSAKKTKLEGVNEDVISLQNKIIEAKVELKQAKKDFESSITESKDYKAVVTVETLLKSQINDTKKSLLMDIASIKSWKEKLYECKHAERNIDYLKDEVAKLKEEFEKRQIKRTAIEKQKVTIKDKIRIENGKIMKREVEQESIQNALSLLKYESAETAKNLKNAQYQHKTLVKKCRLIMKQGQCLQRFQHFGDLNQLMYVR